MEKEKMYHFGNAIFTALIRKGVICSLKRTNDVYDTQYADARFGFGAVYLNYRTTVGMVEEFCPNEEDDYEENEPVFRDGWFRYTGKASNEDLEVTTHYGLKGERLEQTVTVKSTATGRLRLTDLGILQTCHTDFKWGSNAAPNVIGHHFVGGHSSHSAYYRVDGEGSCLVFAPTGGTALTYYDCRAKLAGKRKYLAERAENVPEKGITMLYPLAVVRSGMAEEKGAKLRIGQECIWLAPGEEVTFKFCYFWADHYLNAGRSLVQNGLVHVTSVPGYTLPIGWDAQICIESVWDDMSVLIDEEIGTAELLKTEKGKRFYRLHFNKLGEHTVTVTYAGGRYLHLYYFITEAISTLWDKRAAFIADKQEKDPSLWYNGLLCEWNNESGVRLSPDNYDKIRGWRIYEVTCDDPGLSKPAFLSSKQVIRPKQEEVTALDDYIEHFVWGGLQQTTEEPYPYGIYGIPDWKQLRDSKLNTNRGTLHIWRIYDYPHIALTYYNMYRVARDYPQMQTRLSKEDYLKRAYGTALAMFTIPLEIDNWSAYKTGLYNERVIPWIIEALKECGMEAEAYRLNTHWMRKVRFFVTECKDVFGSEYPFDTTGFESTYYLAEDGLRNASYKKDDSPFCDEIPYDKAFSFMEKQHSCNVACRGYLEPAYFWYGSDYRGNNTHYLLSYMSQMGGCSILDHALYHEQDPYAMLRLGYGSLLSSYALMNTGTEETNYGYWFPGKEHDGAAGGGFESLYEGETWLNQPHHGGSWYYSCEIDLGFCGGVRGASVIFADDPLFGRLVYGGKLTETEKTWQIKGEDGAGRKFHWLEGKMRFHAVLDRGAFAADCMAEVNKDCTAVTLFFDPAQSGQERTLKLQARELGYFNVEGKGEESGNEAVIVLEPGETQINIVFDMSENEPYSL